jgi:uncharacterized protein YdhG (YjbR/CyaY superfamily)
MRDVIREYIEQCPEEVQKKLKEIRSVIEETVPEATKNIAWGMPSYKIKKKFLIHFSVHKAHISLHVGTDGMEAFQDRVKEYSKTKSTLHIKFHDSVPVELLRDMVLYSRKRMEKL